ncbi:helix-turn-helix domain-containing protein [Sporosarcina ureilytica]|uniref:helix-turn-helix domain-containing protein n=1 Tax=Sporosarcina ureilytica TaxID=298596 RepID=UPI001FDF75E6|nr:helix-turn-helix transcriptional regulator [Sporosarcina ureilytica]
MYGILSNENDRKNNTEILASKINDFQIIVLYDRQPNHFDFNYLVNFPSENLKRKLESNIILPSINIKSETFIVWQEAYEENIDLFYNLRINARNEMLRRITEFMVAKFFSTNENYLNPLLKNKPTLKWDMLNKLFVKYETMLSNNTRLNDEKSWEGFSEWFKDYLLYNVIDEMIQMFGYEWLATIDREELNQLFFQKMNKNFSANNSFMNEFTNVVNLYTEKWISETVIMSELENRSIEHITSILNASNQIGEHRHVELLVKSNNLVVMSNVVYQFVIEVLSNKKFRQCENSKWPKATRLSKMLNGSVQLIPYKGNEKVSTLVNEVWGQVENLSELDVDVFDSLCHLFLEKTSYVKDSIEIRLDDLLNIRGLKPKLGGNGRRGGYDKRQREQVLNALSIIQSLWIHIEHVVVYEQGRPIKKSIEGRAFHFKDLNGNKCRFNESEMQNRFLLTIGEVLEIFLEGSGRQVKLLPIQAIEYNPYQRSWEKKIIRYLSWRWRTQARKASYLQPHKISTLLEKLGVPLKSETPSRIRDRFEKALDILVDDGVITYWQYDSWDEDVVTKKGWLRIWQETTVIIAPPDDIIKHYQPLVRNKAANDKRNLTSLSGRGEVNAEIGKEFKKKRVELGLTLQQVSHEIDISTSYLSNIERGRATPSYNLYNRIRDWVN